MEHLRHLVAQTEMKAMIHVNQHNIRHNIKNTSDRRPVITIKTYKSNEYVDGVEIIGPSKLVYSPDKPLSCGARLWLESRYEDVKTTNGGEIENDDTGST